MTADAILVSGIARARPPEALRQELVDPGIAGGDLQVAVEDARRVGQEAIGHRFPPSDRARRPIPEGEFGRPGGELLRGEQVEDSPFVLQNWSLGRVDLRPVARHGASDVHPADNCDSVADSLIGCNPVIYG